MSAAFLGFQRAIVFTLALRHRARMRILAKLLCFGGLVHLFNYAMESHDTLCTFVCKMGVLFLTIALAWHGTSYIWSSHLSLRANCVSTEGKCVLITGELSTLVIQSDTGVIVLSLFLPFLLPLCWAGCDTGFGHATAITLCDAGFTVFAGCLNFNSSVCQALKEKTKNPSKVS